ncbi:MAG: RNA-guided pseudouridylation complex pseudouridine synthase subunit Cbf5 [archaeon]
MAKSIKELLNFGIIIIDKPAGPTSFSVSDYVRKQLGLTKTSHFGTLDPQVTGVLPIALGRACKLTGSFLGHDKTYIGIMHTHQEHEIKELQKIIDENFLGTIKQTPPKKSRVKRQERERDIIRFELLEVSKSKRDFLFISEVQGGTYIRKLCSDLGDKIGGAHMLELRRLKAGIFTEDQSVKLYDFDKAWIEHEKGNSKLLEKIIIPAEDAIKNVLPFYESKSEAVYKLRTGKPLFRGDLEGLSPQDGEFAVFHKGSFVGIYKLTNESKDILARPTFVFTNIK